MVLDRTTFAYALALFVGIILGQKCFIVTNALAYHSKGKLLKNVFKNLAKILEKKCCYHFFSLIILCSLWLYLQGIQHKTLPP